MMKNDDNCGFGQSPADWDAEWESIEAGLPPKTEGCPLEAHLILYAMGEIDDETPIGKNISDHLATTNCQSCVTRLDGYRRIELQSDPVSADSLWGDFASEPRAAKARRSHFRNNVVKAASLLIVGLILGGSAAAYLLTVDARAQRELLEPFVPDSADARPVTIVIGNAELIHPESRKPVRNYFGTDDGKSLGSVYQLIGSLGGNTMLVDVTTTAEVSGDQVAGNEIMIGGPRIAASRFQSIVAELYGVVDSKDPNALKRGYRFRARMVSEQDKSCFLVEADDIGIEDTESGQICPVRYNPDDPNHVLVDAALIVRGRIRGRDILVVAGFDHVGTLAAVRFLANPSPELSNFNSKYQETGFAEMVIQVHDGTSDATVFFGPRGRSAETGP